MKKKKLIKQLKRELKNLHNLTNSVDNLNEDITRDLIKEKIKNRDIYIEKVEHLNMLITKQWDIERLKINLTKEKKKSFALELALNGAKKKSCGIKK